MTSFTPEKLVSIHQDVEKSAHVPSPVIPLSERVRSALVQLAGQTVKFMHPESNVVVEGKIIGTKSPELAAIIKHDDKRFDISPTQVFLQENLEPVNV